MKIKIINPNTTWTMTEDISVAGKNLLGQIQKYTR